MVEASDELEAEKAAGTVDCSTQSDPREEHPRPLGCAMGHETMEWAAYAPAGLLKHVQGSHR